MQRPEISVLNHGTCGDPVRVSRARTDVLDRSRYVAAEGTHGAKVCG